MKFKYFILVLLLSVSNAYTMPGGPPNPPPNFCAQFPNDPSCGTSVPIGDWKWQLGTMILVTIYVCYKLGKSYEEV